MQTITRKGSFDSAHRVMNEKMKCFNLHGHTYLYELQFRFDSMSSIGYAIDFKEIKRIPCQFIDDFLDHGIIVNPHDVLVIKTAEVLNSKIWQMSLAVDGYCNPTVENIAKEIFLICEMLFAGRGFGLEIERVRLYETPNCFTDCNKESISSEEAENFEIMNLKRIVDYAESKGIVNYDDRIDKDIEENNNLNKYDITKEE